MNKRGLLLLTYAFCLVFSITATTPVKHVNLSEVFLKMPENLTPLLSSVDKADFIDFRASDMKAAITNKLGGTSEMISMTENFSNIKMTSKSSVQLKLLPYLDSQVIAVVETVYGSAADSRIQFYNLDWTSCSDIPLIPEFSYLDFINTDGMSSDKEALQALKDLNVLVYSFELSADSTTLHVGFSTLSLLDKSVLEKLTPYLKSSFDLTWSEDGFKR